MEEVFKWKDVTAVRSIKLIDHDDWSYTITMYDDVTEIVYEEMGKPDAVTKATIPTFCVDKICAALMELRHQMYEDAK